MTCVQGKPKTPDALLLIPMGVRVLLGGSGGDEWRVVHWIDSKGERNIERYNLPLLSLIRVSHVWRRGHI